MNTADLCDDDDQIHRWIPIELKEFGGLAQDKPVTGQAVTVRVCVCLVLSWFLISLQQQPDSLL